jgi:hemoglobin
MADDVRTTDERPAALPYALIGEEAGVRRLVWAFYDVMDREPAFARLRAMHAADLAPMRERLADFLVQWMGGPRVYAERHPGRACVASAHRGLGIDAAMADAWMACMRRAFERAGTVPEVRRIIEPVFEQMCQGMRNT